jgi:hypothetical protein
VRQPVIVLIIVLNCECNLWTRGLLSHTGAQYSAVGTTRPNAEVRRVDAEEPQVVLLSLCRMFLVVIFAAVLCRHFQTQISCALKEVHKLQDTFPLTHLTADQSQDSDLHRVPEISFGS